VLQTARSPYAVSCAASINLHQAGTAAPTGCGLIAADCFLFVRLQAKRGKHSSKEVSVPRINDVSAPGQGARAKQYLPFLQRGGKLLGLVESVSSGERGS
jgi:hypothetical protein